MKTEIKSLKDVHERLVFPVCALEELADMSVATQGMNKDEIYECIAIALRKLLDDIEENM